MLVEWQEENKIKMQHTSNFNYIVKEASWFVVICMSNISMLKPYYGVFHNCQNKQKDIQIKTNLCTCVFVHVLYFCI